MLIASIDGLASFPEAIRSVFPKAQVQLCIVHMVRGSLKYVSWKNRKVFVSNPLRFETLGLEEVGEGLSSNYFGPVHLGWLDEQDFRIMDVRDERRKR